MVVNIMQYYHRNTLQPSHMVEQLGRVFHQVAKQNMNLLSNDRMDRRGVIRMKMLMKECAVLLPLITIWHRREQPVEAHASMIYDMSDFTVQNIQSLTVRSPSACLALMSRSRFASRTNH